MSTRKQVVLGFLGTTLDSGFDDARWDRWRPTVALGQHEDLRVDRLDLLHSARTRPLFELLKADLYSVSPESVVHGHEIELSDAWDFEQVYAALLDFVRAYPFHTETEDYLVHITTGTHVAQICLFLLTETRHIPARLLQTSPPPRARGRHGPEGEYRIIDLDLSKYDEIAKRFAREQREGLSSLKAGIDTQSATFNRLMEEIEHVAVHSRAPILLTGPTGAGKTQLARRIYELKQQRGQVTGRFVEVNCATLRGDAAMSALFGHKRGAFTGALQDRAGLLMAANGGLLFLDEIAELGLDEQAMLLRALEEKRFLPVGSDREAESDFQLIAGTNKDPRREVARGRFREDLHARIRLWTFRLPSLVERREDIEPNLRFELDQAGRRSGLNLTLSSEARARFLEFAVSPAALWRGNFRDLAGCVTRMATLAPGGRITKEIVDKEIEKLCTHWADEAGSADDPTGDDSERALDPLAELFPAQRAQALDHFDRIQLSEVVRVCRASRSLADAGRKLFAASRALKRQPNDADRLRKYLLRFGLDWGSVTGK